MVKRSTYDKGQDIEEPCEVKVSSTVLKTSGAGDSLAEFNHTVIELTYNWGVEQYDLGNAYGHIALGVDDIYSTCDQIKARGGKVVREPGPMKHGSTVIAFIEDPNGYKIELIQIGTKASAQSQ